MVVSFFVIILIIRIIDHELCFVSKSSLYHPLQWSSGFHNIVVTSVFHSDNISSTSQPHIWSSYWPSRSKDTRGNIFCLRVGRGKRQTFQGWAGAKILRAWRANVRPSRAGAFFGQGKKAVNHNLLVELSIWRGHVFYTQHNLARSKLRFIPRMLENFVKINL